LLEHGSFVGRQDKGVVASGSRTHQQRLSREGHNFGGDLWDTQHFNGRHDFIKTRTRQKTTAVAATNNQHEATSKDATLV